MLTWTTVEMFKVRMQGQYGAATDKRVSVVCETCGSIGGFVKASCAGVLGNSCSRNTSVCRVCFLCIMLLSLLLNL